MTPPEPNLVPDEEIEDEEVDLSDTEWSEILLDRSHSYYDGAEVLLSGGKGLSQGQTLRAVLDALMSIAGSSLAHLYLLRAAGPSAMVSVVNEREAVLETDEE